ncbi:MAG: amino acid racemase [Lachnospiraceae bacterium]|nr:amino acid racemase [Lachnospiraceae bacterium]
MAVLGVIGGLGPMATAYFMQLVTQMTKAENDQEHIKMLIHSDPGVPDRTSYILDATKENPEPHLVRIGQELAERGAQVLAIPCITAHYFHHTLQEQIGIPMIHTIKETSSYLKKNGIEKVGIMATDGTIKSRLFQQECGLLGIDCVTPEPEYQKDVMHLIYNNVKAGLPVETERFRAVQKNLKEQGAQVILLGCTELSIMKRDNKLDAGFLDVLDVLAKRSVELCGTLHPRFENLITE